MKLAELAKKNVFHVHFSHLSTRYVATYDWQWGLLKGTYCCGSSHYSKAQLKWPNNSQWAEQVREGLRGVGRAHKTVDGATIVAELAKAYKPTVEDVVACILSDCYSIENHADKWEYWSEYGTTPSQEAEESWEQMSKWARILGPAVLADQELREEVNNR